MISAPMETARMSVASADVTRAGTEGFASAVPPTSRRMNP